MKKSHKTAFREGAIPPEFIGQAIANHQTKKGIGGHNLFLGQVRADRIKGKTVTSIVYTAHEELANRAFQEIKERTFQQFDLTCMHIYHSLGEVKAGEICLFVFVSSPRRKACFQAIEYAVEAIKAEAPVFGKEFFDNASYQWKVNTK